MPGSLKLGVRHLAPPEAGLVRALLSLLAQGSPEWRWRLAHEPPFDAVIVDAASPELLSPALSSLGDAVAALGEPRRTQRGVHILRRPLTEETLQSWLESLQDELGATEPAPLELPAPAAAEGSDATRFRLKRWPPAALLQRDSHRIRLATILSRRAFALDELAALSGEPIERCRTFLHLLQGFQLLDVVAEPARPQPPARAATRPPAGLIRSIRSRLGL